MGVSDFCFACTSILYPCLNNIASKIGLWAQSKILRMSVSCCLLTDFTEMILAPREMWSFLSKLISAPREMLSFLSKVISAPRAMLSFLSEVLSARREMLSFLSEVVSASKLVTIDMRFVMRDLSTSGSCACAILLSMSPSAGDFLSEKCRRETWLVTSNER